MLGIRTSLVVTGAVSMIVVSEGVVAIARTSHLLLTTPTRFVFLSIWSQSRSARMTIGRPIIMVDTSDERIVSPFQAWLVREIMTNSSSSTKVLTERDQVMTPSSGYHLSLFANYTLDGIKATLAISVDSSTGVPCGDWSAQTAKALAHEAFQPFSWPVLRDTSPSYTDIKVYNGNEILFHGILRGYRADQICRCNSSSLTSRVRLSVVIAAFVGWKCSVFSFECGGRTYSVGPQGVVVAADHARSRFELRVCSRSSEDAVGNDADRVEFRYRDANNRMDLKCARTSVPATWLTVSHISGPTLIQAITRCREQRARVEGPEQTEQFAQLAAAHNHWWHNAATSDFAHVGVLVSFVGGLDYGNFHVQSESKLHVMEAMVVSRAALAEMTHTQEVQAPVPVGPPALAQGAWQQAAASSDTAVQETSQVALRDRNRAEMESRALTRETQPAAQQAVDYDQNDEEGARGHMIDAARDTARQDRSFARSTAKLTPAQFAELAETLRGPSGSGSQAAPPSTVVVEEAEPENMLAPTGAPRSYHPHRTP
ncbi:unnamed protein product [Symbiodinium sp. CCMP2456]|nr:unnamed protein product [Symbiodinium sp. CCMP2456]